MLDQWQDEMEARFGLAFTVLDRAYATRMRRERGFSVNPWTTHSRFLISHRLLIGETYASGLRDWLGEFAPRTLLILDEAHNAASASGARYAIDSQITRVTRRPYDQFDACQVRSHRQARGVRYVRELHGSGTGTEHRARTAPGVALRGEPDRGAFLVPDRESIPREAATIVIRSALVAE